MYVPWTNFPFSVIKVENQDIISKFGVIGDTSKKGSLTVINLYGAVTFTMGSIFFLKLHLKYYYHNDFSKFTRFSLDKGSIKMKKYHKMQYCRVLYIFWSLGFGDEVTNLPSSMYIYSYKDNAFNFTEFLIIISYPLFSRSFLWPVKR